MINGFQQFKCIIIFGETFAIKDFSYNWSIGKKKINHFITTALTNFLKKKSASLNSLILKLLLDNAEEDLLVIMENNKNGKILLSNDSLVSNNQKC